MDERFQKQLSFLIEVDRMKNVLRQTLIADRSRRENDAEHSWHFAIAAMIFSEYAAEADKTDMTRVLKMALVHDLVEVYAGDTFAYDVQGNLGKAAREEAAADRLFSMLPADQSAEIRALWEEFDRMDTPDSRYAAAIDRLQPFICNYVTEGYTWRLHHVTRAQVYERMDMVRAAAPGLWPFVEDVVRDAMEKGYILG